MLYTTKEAAELCDREHSHVRRLCKMLSIGRLKGKNRYLTDRDLESLQRWIESNGDERKRGRRPPDGSEGQVER